MANKKKPAKPAGFDLKNIMKGFDTFSKVSKLVGVPRTTLVYAVERDEVESVETNSGYKLVSIASAKKFSKNRPKLGPPFREVED